jgi:hypothetical protein
MNKENAHLFLPLVQALADGKTIQFKCLLMETIPYNSDFKWEDIPRNSEFKWTNAPDHYRIKPEPRTFEVWVDSFSNYLYPISTTPYYNWERITVQEVL